MATRRGWPLPPRSCAAHSLVYALLLAALILRGVAFEFRDKSRRLRRLWDAGFVGGSTCAAFVQGTTVGALVQELLIRDGPYVGGPFAWLSPFALLCGVGLCLGDALLGAAWLCNKTETDVRDLGFLLLPRLLLAVLVFLGAAFSGGRVSWSCRSR
jgi:cytochrome d ubiquinol oxidase subunit II